MEVAPAELPLHGAHAGATLTLRPLLSAEMLLPPGWFHREKGPMATPRAFGIGVRTDRQMTIPVVAFLLEHPTVGLVLVDTGFHASIAQGRGSERARNLGPVGQVMSRSVRMRPQQSVAAQLRALGVDPAGIGLVVMTHLHFDHASALSDFPHATVLVSKREWDAAWARGSSMSGYSTAQLDPRPRYRTIDFAASSATSRGPFERTVDVFGDGSLTLAWTPGHTAGHLSLIVRLDGREALLTGDAAYTMGTLREGQRPWRMHDARAFEHSIRQLQAYDRENPDALIVPGHDMARWAQLEEIYA